MVLSISHSYVKATADYLGDIGPVRTCHAGWIKCSTLNRTPRRGGVYLPAYYPYPKLLLVLRDIHTRTRNFCKFFTPRVAIPGVRVKQLLYPPGTSVTYVRPCHNTRNFWKFCNSFIPVPETSGSSVRPPYRYPESTNPTEHSLAKFGWDRREFQTFGLPCHRSKFQINQVEVNHKPLSTLGF